MACGNLHKLRGAAFVCALLFLAAVCDARQNRSKSTADKSAQPEGAALYKRNCAVCHGDDAKGGSAPHSAIFTQPAPNLTTLAQRHGGKFPGDYVANVLRNGGKMPDHGPADMPVWGIIFKASQNAEDAQVDRRIAALVTYLKSLQVK